MRSADMTRTFRTPGPSLLAAALAAIALAALPAHDARSQDSKPSPLDGAWKLVVQKNGDAQDYQAFPEGTEMIKYVTGGRFVWTIATAGRVVSAAGGKYTVDKDKYSETIDYVHGDGQVALVGKTFDFTWKIEGGIWLHTGTLKIDDQSIKIDEKWERSK
jgi:hypothetical protein